MILCLLHESHCTASQFAPYLLLLPEKFDTLMYWNTMELLQLQGHDIIQQIGRPQADAVFKEEILPIVANEKEAFPSFRDLSGRELETRVNTECHRWGSVIMSYAFDVAAEDDPTADPDIDFEDPNGRDMAKALIPLADLLNADTDLANVSFLLLNKLIFRLICLRRTMFSRCVRLSPSLLVKKSLTPTDLSLLLSLFVDMAM
jgi:SET domain-containing protein 6